MGVHWNIRFLSRGGKGGGAWKTNILEAKCLKRRAWIVCRFKSGFGKKEGVDVFEVGWDPNAHCELEKPSYWHKYPRQITL